MLRMIVTIVGISLLSACGSDAQDLAESAAPSSDAAINIAQSSEPVGEVVQLAQVDQTSRFEEGVHYNRLTPTQPINSSPDQVEVTEVFWYGCPHCFAFDPILSDWESGKAEYINFVRIPAVWNPLVRFHAQGFYTSQVLGKEDEIHEAFFDEIHRGGNYLDTPDKLAEFFARFDVSRDEFDSAFNSLEVNTRLQRSEELSRRYQIQSVPSMVINGKYTSNASMTGDYDSLLELVDELAARENNAVP